MNKGAKILLALIALSFLFGCSSTDKSRTKTITRDGFSMTVPSQYRDIQMDGLYLDWQLAYGYGGTDVLVDKVSFETLREDNWDPTLKEYMAALANYYYTNALNTTIQTENRIYTEISGKHINGQEVPLGCYIAVYEGTDAFWIVYLSCPVDAFEQASGEFQRILDSVVIQ